MVISMDRKGIECGIEMNMAMKGKWSYGGFLSHGVPQ
jgi:hypothetical protein